MESQVTLVSTVKELKLLKEIENLAIARDEAENEENPAKALYFRCLIFRKFAILDSFVGPFSGALADRVSRLTTKLNADVEDLTRMIIPRSLEAERVQQGSKDKPDEPFSYLQLPTEVRALVLGWLSSPSDKLNLAKAIPEDGDLMQWNVHSLQYTVSFEQVLYIMLGRNSVLSYNDAANLCHASPELQEAVKSCFERTLVDPFVVVFPKKLFYEFFFDDDEVLLKEIPPIDHLLNPLPATVFIHFFDDKYENEEWRAEHFRILRQMGKHIWKFSLVCNWESTSGRVLEMLQKCLELMPNLRFLSVVVDTGRVGVKPEGDTADLQLPELPSLRKLYFPQCNITDVVCKKVLERYRSVITSLETDTDFCFPPTSDSRDINYPRLTHLDLSISSIQHSEMEANIGKLEPFFGAPLKSLRLQEGYKENNLQNFMSLLGALNRFGGTLEELNIAFAEDNVGIECQDGDQFTGLSCLTNYHFPKVNRMQVFGYPATWTFLLLFPALERLQLRAEFSCRVCGKFFGTSNDILGLSVGKEDMYDSNIWKLLPFLKIISIVSWRSKDLQVTRNQCRIYRRKMARVSEEMSTRSNFKINGSVTVIRGRALVQSGDTGIIVEGNVTGDVVQEGDGCILVNGYVHGKIEQEGNGKIFVREEHRGELVKRGQGNWTWIGEREEFR